MKTAALKKSSNSSSDDYYEFLGNKVHRLALVNWDFVEIGQGNTFGPNCVIGQDAQHLAYETAGKVIIGDNNTFREFVCIDRPTSMTEKTVIGDGNYFMSGSIIHHDCEIEDNVVICSNVSIAGNVTIMKGANLGMNASIHQFQVVGSYTMIGMNSCIIKKSRAFPGEKFAGSPIKKIGKNSIGLKRSKVTSKILESETQRYLELLTKKRIGG